MSKTSFQTEGTFTVEGCKHTDTITHEAVYRICCPWFSHCNCQTVNPAEHICINLVKLIRNLIIRSSLIIEKGAFKVFIGQLKAF